MFNQIQRQYQNDDMVMSQLMELLIAHGVISPEEFQDEPGPGLVSPAGGSSSGIWTPGGGASAGPADEKKLWVPGMD